MTNQIAHKRKSNVLNLAYVCCFFNITEITWAFRNIGSSKRLLLSWAMACPCFPGVCGHYVWLTINSKLTSQHWENTATGNLDLPSWRWPVDVGSHLRRALTNSRRRFCKGRERVRKVTKEVGHYRHFSVFFLPRFNFFLFTERNCSILYYFQAPNTVEADTVTGLIISSCSPTIW